MKHGSDTLSIDVLVEDQNEIGMNVQDVEQVNISAEKVIKYGTGVSDYEKLHNLPTIDGAEIIGDVKGNIEKLFPSIPEWAMQQNPPSYTSEDVGAVSDDDFAIYAEYVNGNFSDVNKAVSGNTHEISELANAVNAVRQATQALTNAQEELAGLISGNAADIDAIENRLSGFAPLESPVFSGEPKATTPDQQDNSQRIATTAFVKEIVSALVNGAPETLDTLGELANAFVENESVLGALNEAIGKKVDKVDGKGLSSNDFTNNFVNKLNGIAENANNYSLPVADSIVRGGIKLGYAQNGRNYPVVLNQEKAYVNVPWVDNSDEIQEVGNLVQQKASQDDLDSLSNEVSELNDNLGGCSFGYTDDGEPGFRKPGADAVIPFSKKLDGNVLQYPFYQQNGIVIDTAGYYAFVCNGAASTSNFDIMINGKTMHTVFAFQNGDYYNTLGFAYLNVGDIINKSSSVSGYRLCRIT